jgi:hypothetical protein
VHFCEQTGVGNWLNVFVHTPLVHSVLVSLTVTQPEPKLALFEPEPDPEPALSTGGGLLPLLQATATATDNASAKKKALCISRSYRVPNRSDRQVTNLGDMSVHEDTVSPERHLHHRTF